jgi:hypothetical protein
LTRANPPPPPPPETWRLNERMYGSLTGKSKKMVRASEPARERRERREGAERSLGVLGWIGAKRASETVEANEGAKRSE